MQDMIEWLEFRVDEPENEGKKAQIRGAWSAYGESLRKLNPILGITP